MAEDGEDRGPVADREVLAIGFCLLLVARFSILEAFFCVGVFFFTARVVVGLAEAFLEGLAIFSCFMAGVLPTHWKVGSGGSFGAFRSTDFTDGHRSGMEEI
jgi:hypothetical protein